MTGRPGRGFRIPHEPGSPAQACRCGALLTLAATLAWAPTAWPAPHDPASSAAPDVASAAARAYFRDLKRMQQEIILSAARRHFERADRLPRAKRPGAPRSRARFGMRPPADHEEAAGAQGSDARRRPGTTRTALQAPANRRMNDRSSDLTQFANQSEVSIAAFGPYLVAAWNDANFFARAGTIGFGYSLDGGGTWTDSGTPPLAGRIAAWSSDPVVAVDQKTGTFYLAAMAITVEPPSNAIVVVAGTFSDSGFAWGAPVAARSVRDTLPDKPWLACDSLSGNLYLSYTAFMRRELALTGQIEFQRSADGNRTWSPPIKLSDPRDDGLVQGSRPAVGPDGEVYVVWGAVDTTEASGGQDWKRIRKSLDLGLSFGPEAAVAAVYSNFGSGAPGYNRGYGHEFPANAVDRSRGPTVVASTSPGTNPSMPSTIRRWGMEAVRRSVAAPAATRTSRSATCCGEAWIPGTASITSASRGSRGRP